MLTILFLAVGIFILVVATLDSIVIVKPFHFGIRRMLGNQLPTVLSEGPHLRLPFIMSVQMASLELTTLPVKTTFTTKDGLAMTATGSLKVKADPKVKLPDERVTFLSMREETITAGLNDTIESRLGALGGTVKGSDLKERRHAVNDFFNCILRLEKAPHLDHVKGDPKKCGLGDKCEIKAVGPIPADEIVPYYSTHFEHVNALLKNTGGQKSATENLYGLSIELFDLATLNFSSKTQDALEEEKQAEQRVGAFEEKLDLVKRVVTEVPGATPQIAVNFVEDTMTPGTTRRITSIEGEAGVLGGLVSAIAAGKEK